MANWKQLKNWLDQNITENDNLLVKIRAERQNEYGELSTTALTNFCDSLEATLDNNDSHHLFPAFSDNKYFRELFNYQDCYFGKKTNQEKVNETDYYLLEKMFNEWKLTQSRNITTLKEKFEQLKTEIIEDSDNEKRNINLVAELRVVVRINIELQRNRTGFFDSMLNSMFQGNDYVCQKSENLTKFIDMATVNDSPPNPPWAIAKSSHYNMFFDQQVKNRQVVVSLEALMAKLDEVIAEDTESRESSRKLAGEVFSLLEIAVKNEEEQEKLKVSYQILEKENSELKAQLTQCKKESKELQAKLLQKEAENQSLKEEIKNYKNSKLQVIISKKENELKKVNSEIVKKHKLDEESKEELDNLLELQAELINNNLPVLEKQLEKTKKRISKVITNEETDLLCKIQKELTELQKQEQKFEAKIEMPF
jgi:hypothetical protein